MSNTNGSPTTATVETLTAEVHVLQVGNRQITLSVVKQLDRVAYEDIVPMGRVRAGRKDEFVRPNLETSDIEVVGRHKDSSALCFAYAPSCVWAEKTSRAWQHWMFHTDHRKRDVVVARGGGQELVWTVERGVCYCPNNNSTTLPNPYQNSWVWMKEQQSGDYDPLKHWCYAEFEYWRKSGTFCDMDTLEAQWKSDAKKALDYQLERTALHDEAKALPLIVLAGLK